MDIRDAILTLAIAITLAGLFGFFTGQQDIMGDCETYREIQWQGELFSCTLSEAPKP